MTSRRLAAFALAVALLSAATGEAAEPRLPDNPLSGRLLFEDRNCSQCHGLSGDGPGIGPDLGGGSFDGSFLDLGAALWNHVPGMSVALASTDLTWPTLTAEEATELLSFLYFIDYLGQPGDPTEGQQLFRREGCASCHSVDGRGGKSGPDLGALETFSSPLAVAQDIWNHGPAMLEMIRQRGLPPPTFEAGDLANLSAFLRRLGGTAPLGGVLPAPGSPNRGRTLFAAKGCAVCHGDDARGGDGPDLARAGLPRSAEAIAGKMWSHALSMRTEMQARGISWPTLSTEELADVVAFLYFLPFPDPPGDADRGAAVFVERSCAECHATGETGQRAPELTGGDAGWSAAGLVSAMWSHAPLMSEEILAEGRPWPELTGEQLRDLLAFLERESAAP